MEIRIHRILFVDDDPLVLRGFRRSVEDFSDRWDVDFASSGQEALLKLAQRPFDALVTDMHMPGMDGVQLLELVYQQMPGVMRFVLSGNTTNAQVLKSTRLVHQMIAKPCDMEKIFDIVERSCRLRDMLADPNLLRIITGTKRLPSVPLLYNRLLKELQSQDASAQVVANIIAQDAAMTAKILQLVNSAFFSLPENVSNPQRAVTILGLNTVKALVLGIQVFSEYQDQSNLPVSVDGIWKHSMQVSSLAYAIARELNLSVQEREDVRVSGVLHDVGILLYFKMPTLASKIRFNVSGLISIDSEYKSLNTSHAEMGGYLLGIWGLPISIVEAVAFHHKPWLQVSKKADVVTVLYIANGLLNMCQFEENVKYPAYLDMNYVHQTGLVPRLEDWRQMAKELITSSAPSIGGLTP